MSVNIENNSGTRFDFHYRQVIDKVAKFVLDDKKITSEMEINVIIVSPEEIRLINKDTRNKDKTTDVLSFPYMEFDEAGVMSPSALLFPEYNILGDIILCGDIAKEQAKLYGHSQKREVAFLIVHSMLHLVGYDHEDQKDRIVMEAEQDRIMELLGILR